MDDTTVDRKPYETPELSLLGTVRELTEATAEKCTGSADAILPRVIPDREDFFCGPDATSGPS
ncbi:MAG TPA: lasso RiPP family leader peptide-containing protein [Gemmatimonadota bacterium]|nr:lasso RiPP family leader peptide-containing protein [Gemmatimonadota bacterium]